MSKLTLVICEGLSDKRALEPLFPQSEYVIIHGDFITDRSLEKHEIITEHNVLTELNKMIISEVTKLQIKTKLKFENIERILYVTDSDRCFEY